MRKVKVKRLVYRGLLTRDILYGDMEYDSNLTNENILGSIFTVGKHEWHPGMNGIYQVDCNGTPIYHITVETFYQYQKSWYNLLSDIIKRILRI